MSKDQLRNFGEEGILTNEQVDERSIITSPTDKLTKIVLTKLNAEAPFESKPCSIIRMIFHLQKNIVKYLLAGYLFHHWKVKDLFHAWAILVLVLFVNRLLSLR